MVLEKGQILHEAPKKEPRKIPTKLLAAIGISIGGLILVCLIVILGMNAMKGMKVKGIESAFQAYTNLMGNSNYEEVYGQYLSSSFKKDLDVKGFKDMSEFYREKMGPFFEKKIEDRQFIEVEGKQAVDILCAALYPTGPAVEKYLMVKEGGKWKIEGFHLVSPALSSLTNEAAKGALPEDLPPEVAQDLSQKRAY